MRARGSGIFNKRFIPSDTQFGFFDHSPGDRKEFSRCCKGLNPPPPTYFIDSGLVWYSTRYTSSTTNGSDEEADKMYVSTCTALELLL